MPPRRSPSSRRRERRDQPRRRLAPGVVIPVLVVVVVIVVTSLWSWSFGRPARIRGQIRGAELAALAGDHAAALEGWRWVNQVPGGASAATWLAEARAALALDRAAEADRALIHALDLDPAGAEGWRLRLEILRVEDRPAEAFGVGRMALEAVVPDDRRGVLRALTLAVLAELPDDQARDLLRRWIAADPADVDARVALLNRMANAPRDGDLDRARRIAELATLLDRDPGHVFAREALTVALADAGEVDRGRAVLDAWPASARDARYDRLKGRWDLDYDHRPDRASESFRRAIVALPHDWKAHYGLARALRALGRDAEARQEAEAVARLRELLAPSALGPRLISAMKATDNPRRAAADLASLCDRAGLATLAVAWRREAEPPSGGVGPFAR